jgi:iron complex outermembrane recepter protein
MFKRTKVSQAAWMLASSAAFLVGSPAFAQGTPQRVEITGSAIKRIDAETVVPVTILKIEDLKAQGVTSVEQIMGSLGAVQMTQGSSQQVGSGTGGAAFADLRGIGSSKTLVLLNGRRVANNAIDGAAPDLNMIPFAALSRVEVLRDGASSLYGTDAIGGVINFITRGDFQGGAITLGADKPQAAGGKASSANIGFGFGDLSKSGFNVFGFLDLAKTDPIGGEERPFNSRFPGGLSPTPSPGNYFQDSAVGNPAAPNCNDPSYLVPVAGGTSCNIATSKFVDYTAKAERVSGMLRGTLRVATDHNLTGEWFYTRNESTTRIAPVPYGGIWMNPTRPDGTPNPFYPGNPGAITPNITLSPTFIRDTNADGVPDMTPRAGVTLQPGFINVRWRANAGGQRTNISLNEQQRLVAGMDGVLGAWDYQAAVSYNENKIKETVAGYSDGNKITQGVLNGIINPFGAQNAAGDAFIADALLGGNLQNHRGKVTGVDTRISRELGDWLNSGRKVSFALGAEYRKEDFRSGANKPIAELLQASTGVDPDSLSEGTRNVTALYSELNVPITKQLDLTAAFRYDKYSDFGNTTNPKIGLRYQPSKELLLRASYSTGFRAPSLYELNALQSYTNTGTVDDPVNCPNGVGINGKPTVLVCEVQFQRLTGGNKALQPEKAKNFTVGLVFEPANNLSLGLDLWWLKLTDQIGALSETTVLADPTTFASYIRRNAGGNLSTDGFSCPGSDCGYLDLRQQNLGNLNANGLDLSAQFRQGLGNYGRLTMGFNASYMTNYEYQDYIGGPYNQNVGVYVGVAPIFRLQYSLSANWNMGPWTVGAVGRSKSGYLDQDPSNRVPSYNTVDGYVSWAGVKGLNLTLGVTNLFDQAPPYSNQGEVFQANYDPRFSDPTGRKYYVRASYSF